MSSYRDINYAIRPAKNIERKMLSELFQRLIFIDKLENYRYIGFGSTYFSDFEIFHRNLNISKMISIEGNGTDKLRFKFNRAFSCIDIKFFQSDIILPRLKYQEKDIIWLDYDKQLKESVFDDIDTIVSKVQSGSVILISINVEPPRITLCEEERKDPKIRKEKIIEALEQLNISLGNKLNIRHEISPRNKLSILKDWNFAKKCRELIDNQIKYSLSFREIAEQQNLTYQQLFNFHYDDDAKMLTVGGIILDSETNEKVTLCNFSDLYFFRNDENVFYIDPPNLTYREIKYLNKYMSLNDISKIPKDDADNKIDKIVPMQDIKKFQKIYRYFPTFSESNL